MGRLLLQLGWPLAFVLCFALQSDISPAQGIIGTILALPITLMERITPSNVNLVYVFAGLGTFLFALREIHLSIFPK